MDIQVTNTFKVKKWEPHLSWQQKGFRKYLLLSKNMVVDQSTKTVAINTLPDLLSLIRLSMILYILTGFDSFYEYMESLQLHLEGIHPLE